MEDINLVYLLIVSLILRSIILISIQHGMVQEYQIGQMLRERYNEFLPDVYDTDHVYAYASGVGRTKASLELVLAALYPPSEKLTWNRNLNWMPIPIYSNPRPLDILVKSRNCPK